MSCSMTIDAVRARTKTVTRRHVDTWRTLKPGDRLTLIEKGMGLKKGEHQVEIVDVEIVSNTVVPLAPMSLDDLGREGFDVDDPLGLSIEGFYEMWLTSHGYQRPARHLLLFEAEVTKCRRIEWRYLEGSA